MINHVLELYQATGIQNENGTLPTQVKEDIERNMLAGNIRVF